MKKVLLLIIILLMLSGCSSETDEKTIRVGALTAPNAEILELAAPELEKEGYNLEIIEYSDLDEVNNDLLNGEIDANYFQTRAFLDKFNADNETNLKAIGDIHYEPTALYGGRAGSVYDIRNNSTIVIPEDSINQARALKLLSRLGYIGLKETETPSLDDIESNKYNINFLTFPENEIARQLENVDMAVVNGNYAIEATLDLNGDYFLASEDINTTSQNPVELVVREGEENSEKSVALLKALQSKSVKEYIDKTYDGNAVSSVDVLRQKTY